MLGRWQVNRSVRCGSIACQSRSPSPMRPCRNTSGGPWPCTVAPMVTPSVVVTWWVRWLLMPCLLGLVTSCLHDDGAGVGEHHPTGYISATRGVLQVAASDLSGQVRASVDVHLGVDIGQVLLDRVHGDEQALTDRDVGVALRHQPHDVAFGGGQRRPANLRA